MTQIETDDETTKEINDEEMDRRVNELIGDGYYAAGDLSCAMGWYRSAGAKAKLFELGSRLLDADIIGHAIEAFEAAERIPCQKLIELGTEKFAAGNLHHACTLFESSKEHDKLRQVAETALSEGVLGVAHAAFSALGDTEKLIEVAEAALVGVCPWIAYDCYMQIGDKRRLAGLGSWHLERGDLEKGLSIFKELEKEPPRGKLIACGEKCMGNGKYNDSKRCFELVRSSEHLVRLGNAILKSNHHDAEIVYRSAARIEVDLEPLNEVIVQYPRCV